MLTWAYAWFAIHVKEYMPLLFLASIGGDVSIIYFICSAVAGRAL